MYFWIFTFFIMAQYMVKLVCFSISPHTTYWYILIWLSDKQKGKLKLCQTCPSGQVLSKIVCQPLQVPHTLYIFINLSEMSIKRWRAGIILNCKKTSGCQFTQKTRASVCKTLCPQHVLAPKYDQSKKISNDQEQIQSDHTSCPQNQKGNHWIQKLTTVYEKHAR